MTGWHDARSITIGQLQTLSAASSPNGLDLDLDSWVADGVVSVVLFVATVELKRELIARGQGQGRRSLLPFAAGGAAGAALVMSLWILGPGEGLVGWEAPTARGLAVGVGVLALLGTRLPDDLRALLLTFAVSGELLAITILAVFYSDQRNLGLLAVAALPLVASVVVARRRIGPAWLFVGLAVVAWVLVHESGVRPTFIGALLGLAVPMQAGASDDLGLGPRPGIGRLGRIVRHLRSGIGVDPQLVEAMLDAYPDAVVVVDASGRIQLANNQVQPVFGYRPSDLVGQSVEVLVPTQARTTHPGYRSGYSRRPMGLLQLSAVRQDGTEFPAEISLAPVSKDVGDQLTMATVRDVTQRVELEAETERARNELLATVTHELRTPLTSILGYAELMGDLDELGPQASRMLAVIQRNAERELKLVTDLLTVAVGDLGRDHLSLEAVDVVDLVRQVVEEHVESARAAELDLIGAIGGQFWDGICGNPGASLDEDARSRFLIQADGGQLLQVLDNLLSNAIKFSPPAGIVTLAVDALTDSVVLSVGNTGSGISADEHERVFERLYRGHNALSRESPGAGLGLSIVQSIVNAHRGVVAFESEPGIGTLVTVQLPLSP